MRTLKTDQEKAADRLRRQGIKKRAERWQDMLAAGIALLRVGHSLHKTEPPVKIVRPMGAGKYEVVFTRAGDADFEGGYCGLVCAIEAKDTAGTEWELSVLGREQSERLALTHDQDGIALVALRFGDEGAGTAWAIPWSTIRAMREGGKRSVTADELEAGEFLAYRIRCDLSCGKMVALIEPALEEEYFSALASIRERG